MLPKLHFWFALIGVIIFVPSLGMILAGPKPLVAQAEIGIFIASFLVWISMAMFATIVFKATSSKLTA